MANGHGGARTPAHPASVSGPGKYSRRTDGRQPVRDLTGGSYGSGQEFQDIQAGAKMAASGEAMAHASSSPPAVQAPTSLADPGDPSQPITAGADAGPGPGMDSLGLPPQDQREQLRQQFGDWIPVLVRMADDPLSSQQLKQQVRYILSNI